MDSSADFEVKEFRDSRLFYVGYFGVASTLAFVSSSIWGWGTVGLVIFGAHAIYSAQRLLTRRTRLSVTADGIVDKNFWYSPGLIPWANIRDVHRTPTGIIKLDLVDGAAFLDKLSPIAMMASFKRMILGYGPAAIVPWGLNTTSAEVMRAIEMGLDSFVLDSVRQSTSFDPATQDALWSSTLAEPPQPELPQPDHPPTRSPS